MLSKINPTQTMAWKSLQRQMDLQKDETLTDIFQKNPDRFNTHHIEFENILVDFSKTHLQAQNQTELLNLCREINLKSAIEAQFSGEKINETEHRAVLHTALRNFSGNPVAVDGKNIMPDIQRVLAQMKAFTEAVHNGTHRGFSGKKIDTIVNIGIGGSDLGPVMVCRALKHYAVKDMKVHFVSNVDGTHITETLNEVNPETTLFLIVSKTFTTQETMANAKTAKKWFLNFADEVDVSKHFVAISTNTEAVVNFGIARENMFEFWDFVGGRFSLWSAVGLSIALYCGYDCFETLLKGAEAMDIHFLNTPFEKNIPVMMALISIFYTNFLDYTNEAVLPYEQYLDRFPAYLQQGIMESNGKTCDRNGNFIDYATCPIVWGEPGTNGQHSFYQLIHQGTAKTLSIFMAGAQSLNPSDKHHEMLLSNFFAQPEALMKGRLTAENNHKVFKGNHPTISILYQKLTPRTLGALIALFEHRTFVQGVIWNIFSYDQWGVELGKELANKILPELENDTGELTEYDLAWIKNTRKLIADYHAILEKLEKKEAAA